MGPDQARRLERLSATKSSRPPTRFALGNRDAVPAGAEVVGRDSPYAERRARPRRRRALIIAWPARVDMRCRNPCFRARFLTFGWNVRFILLPCLGIAPLEKPKD